MDDGAGFKDLGGGPSTPRAQEPVFRRRKLCLAASGGGHVRQLLDLEPVWSRHDSFFVTEDTALGRSLADKHRTHFIPHMALGQARLGGRWKMLSAAVKSVAASARIVLRERPEVVITTGAGAVVFVVLWARLLGAKVVVVESFARFDHPSMFMKLASPLAHHLVVQSPALARFYPQAKVFDPLKRIEPPKPQKEELLFATVGATLPFDRLVKMVADAKTSGDITEQVLIQQGIGGFTPAGLDALETLPFDQVQETLKRAKIVVCHGGTGSLITALRQGCQVIAVPRLFERGEHYDDHQAEITSAFAARGLIQAANTQEEFVEALRIARTRPPISATTDPSGLIAFLDEVLSELPAR